MRECLLLIILLFPNLTKGKSFHMHAGILGGNVVRENYISEGSKDNFLVGGAFIGGSYQKHIMEYGGELGIKYQSVSLSIAYNNMEKSGTSFYFSPFINVDLWNQHSCRFLFGARTIIIERDLFLPILSAGIRSSLAKKHLLTATIGGTYLANRYGAILNVSFRF
jgi:hypothetical protein